MGGKRSDRRKGRLGDYSDDEEPPHTGSGRRYYGSIGDGAKIAALSYEMYHRIDQVLVDLSRAGHLPPGRGMRVEE